MDKIYKIGAIILRDRKLLLGKTKGKFTMPGGRVEKGETDIECLKRELMEEYGTELISYEYFDTFEDDAASDPSMKIVMKVYFVEIKGEPKAQSEVEESIYVNSKIKNINFGSIARDFVIPELKKRDLID